MKQELGQSFYRHLGPSNHVRPGIMFGRDPDLLPSSSSYSLVPKFHLRSARMLTPYQNDYERIDFTCTHYART